MKKLIFVILLASSLVLSGCDIGFGHNKHNRNGGGSGTYELQADGSWKDTKDGSTLSGTDGAYIAELDKAPASGGQPSNVTAISNNYEYTNTSGTAKMVIIRTTGGNLTINAPLDTVLHYGEAGTVNVIAVASSSYDGYAAITQKLVAKAGHIKLFDLIAAAIPLIEVPADATGAVAVDIPENVEVAAVTVASAKATNIKIEGSVSTITNTGTATPTVEVAGTGIVDKVTGDTDVTVSGDGYVADDNGAEKGESPDDLTSNPMKIYTAKGLKTVATTVNGGNNLSGKTVQLQRNINLMDESWTPIGVEATPFAGTFDGNGKTISGLNLDTVANAQGLFSYAKNSTIKNVTIAKSTGTVGKHCGILIGISQGSIDLEDCVIAEDSSITGTDNIGAFVGKIEVGEATAVTLKGLANYGTITATSGTCRAGGLVGSMQQCDQSPANDYTISNCHNYGTIAGTNNGGLIGSIHGDMSKVRASASEDMTHRNLIITGCSNSCSSVKGEVIAMLNETKFIQLTDFIASNKSKVTALAAKTFGDYSANGLDELTIGSNVYIVFEGANYSNPVEFPRANYNSIITNHVDVAGTFYYSIYYSFLNPHGFCDAWMVDKSGAPFASGTVYRLVD